MKIAAALLFACFLAALSGTTLGKPALFADMTPPPLLHELPTFSSPLTKKKLTDEELEKEATGCVKLSIQIVDNITRGVSEERYLEGYHRYIAERPDLSDQELLDVITFRAMARASYQKRWALGATVHDLVEAGALACLSARSK